MKIEIITCLPMPDYLLDRLAGDYRCLAYDFVADTVVGGPADVSGVRAIAMTGEAFLREAFLDKLPRLEVISVFGVGYDGVPVDYCRQRGIAVAHTPGVMTEDAADVATALVLMTSRGLLQADRYLRRGDWLKASAPLASSVTGKTAGIIGLGRIGRAIARRLAALGMKISYVEQAPNPGFDYRHVGNVRDLAAQSDFLIVACPGGPATRNLVDAGVLAALGPAGILINGARGSIVDEAALIDALKRGAIKGAGLDVYAAEPNVPEELIGMENVVLFPHIGSATLETRATMTAMCKDNLDSWFMDGKTPNRIPEFA
ncbi:MAG: 2-hydroxyacid dehydrogenase [Mesorhizobium sp.]